jgi:zinc-ribbon domain
MSKFFFYPVLQALGDGKIIRKSVSVVLQVLAFLSLLSGAYLLVQILKLAFQLPTDGTVGGLLFAIVFLAMILAIAQVFWYRARSVRELADSPFTVIPIVSILFRTIGEVYATLGISMAVGGCLFIWFAKSSPSVMLGSLGGLLPSTSADASFLGGLMFLVYLSLASFVVLILFYFLAESSVVLVDVAKHVRMLVRMGSPPLRCPACSFELEPDARFCPNCGAKILAATSAGA